MRPRLHPRRRRQPPRPITGAPTSLPRESHTGARRGIATPTVTAPGTSAAETATQPASATGATPAPLDPATLSSAASVATTAPAQDTSNPSTAPQTPLTASTLAAMAVAASAASPAAMAQVAAKPGSAGGREIPLSASARSATPHTAKEKLSAAGASEGSFLQSGTSSQSDDTNPLNALNPLAAPTANTLAPQAVTGKPAPARTSVNDLAAAPALAVGTGNDIRKDGMNTDLASQMMTSLGTTNTAAPTGAEVKILLSTNNDFDDALKQVIHIAQLNDATAAQNPTRVAIELQTPPGAIVNVYVSKQDDQYRAQLSTSDPVALSWVQDKISSLKQDGGLGVEVKWLPAQMESAPVVTTSTGGSNLNWNRDGQNQPGANQQQQQEEQSQRQRKAPLLETLAAMGASPFADALASLGRAA
ncbi:MAG: hypothetical protein WDO13_05950 [Verrucomicrobiota bacterium]